MKYRLKFTKLNSIKFIGHLDLIHIFQRAIKRADLPIVYSKGFNPHQLTSFAFPLSVGYESIGEYVDIELYEAPSDIYLLNDELPKGIKIVDYMLLSDTDRNVMSIVGMARYEAATNIDMDIDLLNVSLADFLSQDEILITKKSKGKVKEINIRNGIRELVIFKRDRHVVMDMVVSAGSVDNLKANLVVESFYYFLGIPFNIHQIDFKRIELYTINDQRSLIPTGARD